MAHRKRRQRAKYTMHQLNQLEQEFEKNRYPNAWDREGLAQTLGIHETRIQVRDTLEITTTISARVTLENVLLCFD